MPDRSVRAAKPGASDATPEQNLSGLFRGTDDAGVAARFRRLGVPGVHVVLGPPAALYAHYQLDAAGIESAARQLLAGFGRPT
jgi:transketolase